MFLGLYYHRAPLPCNFCERSLQFMFCGTRFQKYQPKIRICGPTPNWEGCRWLPPGNTLDWAALGEPFISPYFFLCLPCWGPTASAFITPLISTMSLCSFPPWFFLYNCNILHESNSCSNSLLRWNSKKSCNFKPGKNLTHKLGKLDPAPFHLPKVVQPIKHFTGK